MIWPVVILCLFVGFFAGFLAHGLFMMFVGERREVVRNLKPPRVIKR